MTAMNLFARPDGAWIIADAASYHADGRVLGFRSKIVACDLLKAAMSAAGRVPEPIGEEIACFLEEVSSQEELVAELPAFLRALDEFERDAERNGATDHCGDIPRGIRLALAMWSEADDAPFTAIIATTEGLAGGARPFELRRIRTLMFSPPLESYPWADHTFSPMRHGRILAGLQRSTPNPAGQFLVGGWMDAVRVNASGCQVFEMAKWRDRIGNPVDGRSWTERLLRRVQPSLA